MQPRKRFAQHWLQSETVLDEIVAAANIQPQDRILEIGPGMGVLTRRLLPFVSALVAVEIDRDLCKKLVKSLGDKDNFLLLQGDFLELDLALSIVQFAKFQKPNKVVANIPYNITGPILEKLLGKIAQPSTENYESIVLLVQKEVGDRLVADPGTKAFGALSVRVQYLAETELICPVPASSFYPPPKVDSAVIKITPKLVENPANNPKFLETIVKVSFSSKRKMLRNNLKGMFDPDYLSNLLTKLHINPQARAEELSLTDWINLSNNLSISK